MEFQHIQNIQRDNKSIQSMVKHAFEVLMTLCHMYSDLGHMNMMK